MNAKGLLADSSKLTTWRAYRDQLAHQVGLLMADPEKSRFVKDRRAFRMDSRAFDVRANEWQMFVAALCKSLSEFVSRRHRRILMIDPDKSNDPTLLRKVQDWLTKAGSARTPSELMAIFESMYSYANESAVKAHREGTKRLNTLATRLHARVRADKQVHRDLVASLDEHRSDRDNEEDTRDADSDESLDADQEAAGERPTDDIELINRVARSLLRKLTLRRGIAGVRLTKLEQTLLDHVGVWIDDEALDALAPKLLTSLVRSSCAGSDRNVVDQIGPFYLWLRRTHFAKRLSRFLHPGLRDRVAESRTWKGKRICPDELDLVLFLQLWLLRLRRAAPSSRSRASNRSMAFESSLREVIAVDEATDFSPTQLACMAMLANPKYDCVTLSGDLMQRMTDFGLSRWEEYESVAEEIGLAPVRRAALRVSYRQSHRLLAVTTRLYEGSTGSKAPTRSPYPPSDHDPLPLFHVGTNQQDCAEWMARRIVEIRRSYDDHGVIPTIAVLVSDESSVDNVADALEEAPALGGNVEIDRCHGGRVLGDGASVRVFNVEHIKGLEFEAAFFHDMGAIAARFPGLTEKLLYVGLSRASLYLGITAIGHRPEVLNPLVDDLVDGHWSA